MNPFDDLTLGEVEELTALCLNGKSFADSDPFALAGGVLYMHRRRDNPSLDWAEFKGTVKMGELKAFSELINADSENPTNGDVLVPS